MDTQIQIKKLKDLFSRFSCVVNDINVLHDSNVLWNKPIINTAASSNFIHCPTILPTKSCEQSVALNDSMHGFDLVSSGNGNNNGYLNVSVDGSAILPTKSSENSAALSDTTRGFDFVSSGNGNNNGYLNVSVDGSAILPTKSSENSAALSDTTRGFDFVSSGNGNNNGYLNVSVDGSAILPTKSSENSAALSDTTRGFDFVSSGNGNNNGYLNVSVDGSAILPTKSSENSAALSDTTRGFDFVSSGNGNNNGYLNVSVDGSAILPTKSSENSAALSDTTRGFDFVSSGNGNNNGYLNVSVDGSAILPTKSSENSAALSDTTRGFDFVSSGNGNNNGYLNVSVDGSAILPTKSSENSAALSDTTRGFDFVSSGNGNNNGYLNVSVDGSAILPTKSSENSAALSDTTRGFDFVSSGNGNNNGYLNVSVDGSAILPTKSSENSAALSDTTRGFDFVSSGNGNNNGYLNVSVDGSAILPTKSSENSAALSDTMCGFDFVSSGNGNNNGYLNVSVDGSAILPTKSSENSAALSDTTRGFDFVSSGNGNNNGYLNVSVDGSAILPTKSSENSAALSDTTRGFDFVSSGNGNNNGYLNVSVDGSAILPTKSSENSAALSDTTRGFDFVSSGNGNNNGYLNVSVDGSAILPTKSSENSAALSDTTRGFDFVSSGNGNNNGYLNVSVDGSAILPTKSSENSAALSDTTRGFDFVSSGNGNNNGYLNVSVDESAMLSTKSSANSTALSDSMSGFDFVSSGSENDSGYRNKTLQTNTVNYFYYLLPDGNDAYDTLDITESEIGLLNVIDSEVEPLNVAESVVETLNVVEFEVEPLNVVSGSTDDSTELDCFNLDIIAGPLPKSSNVIDVSNASVVPEKCKETKHQSPPDSKIAQSCYIDIKPHNGCDNVNMFVPTSDVKTKKLCCAYCHKRYPKLVRHLETVHKNEVEVIKFRDLPKGSNERRDIINTIRKRGQFEWNTNEKLNGGELSTSRRPNKKFQKQAIDFNTCAKCFGTFSLTMLRKHWNNCTRNSMKGERTVKQLGHAVEGRIHPDACFDLRTVIFPSMRQDASVRLIRFDWLVIEFGNDLCLNYSPHFQQAFIRKKLREAGKLLLMAKSISPEITDFASLYHVKHCNSVIEAIRTISRFDLKAKQVGSPGTASALGTLINAIGELLSIETMKRDDPEKEKNVERFLKVFKKEARLKINKLVAATQSKSKRARHEDIPTTNDVNRLITYLDRERNKCFIELSKSYSYERWFFLSKLTLASILVFNRRRTGEMQNISVADFQGRHMFTSQCSSGLGTVPEETTELIKSRMKIRGKLNRTVPVLLKHTFDECLDLLLLHRKDAGISDENEFLFALPTQSGRIKVVDACSVMSTFSKSCGAENPDSLRGTKLRKHLASLCATLNLNDNDVTNVANFMGHSDKIHRDIYRHNTIQREVVQMTTLLQAAQGNDINTGTSSVNIESEEPTLGDIEAQVAKRKRTDQNCRSQKMTKASPGTSGSKKQEVRGRMKTTSYV